MNEALSTVTCVLGVASFVGAFVVSARLWTMYTDPYPAIAAGLVVFSAYSFLLFARLTSSK